MEEQKNQKLPLQGVGGLQKLPLQGAGGAGLRVAVKADCARILELIIELAIFEKEPDAVTATLTELEEAGFGPKPVWKAFVVEDDGIIVGFALYYIRYSTWKGQRLYLEDLVITESHRGKGLGKLLFDRLIQETRELGFSGMVWQVLDWNEPAIQFYKKYEASIEAGWLNASLSKEQINNF
ncbi:GNAT family N-acetyltransferase [Mucilaginibacter psychrotolerans]|uniref:GNAT family N-acetyltransferase n=1 Tax=Mucilaginibacter psychrotolerans TaxID=1524096 RepID=A0A4Y8SAC8_9SPHI|nr:GNAT family N-acetyltransferase [Mucilaginibacter psychrotolerans]TFF35631.1 GNAT family N-acetyltransferase [Mucilaginibacter psychrotolerans]